MKRDVNTELNIDEVDEIYEDDFDSDAYFEKIRSDSEKYYTPDIFRSNVCHKLKRLGDIGFLIDTLEKDDITYYYETNQLFECYYLLAMLDYISRINDVPQCDKYNEMRRYKLSETVYPMGILMLSTVMKDESIKEKAKAEAIPEFIRFNIVEKEVRDVA